MSSPTSVHSEKVPTLPTSRPASLVSKPVETESHALDAANAHHPLANLTSVKKHILLFVFAVVSPPYLSPSDLEDMPD